MSLLNVKNTRAQNGEEIWKTVDDWMSTYWSGLDARIYAGNVYLDEIIALQYEMQEMVIPIYSYASYTHDRVLHGSRRVAGAFSINFKRESYLFELLSQIETGRALPGGNEPPTRDEAAFRLASRGTATLEDFTAAAGKSNPFGRKNSISKDELAKLRKTAGAFEEAIWGTKTPVPLKGQPRTSPQRSRFELSREWDLHIHFGSNDSVDPRNVRRDGKPLPGQDTLSVSTYTRLVDVHITGVSRIVDDSGRPLLEQYQFLAKDVL